MDCPVVLETHGRRPRGPRWRRVLLAAATIGATSLACIPAATAKSAHEHQSKAADPSLGTPAAPGTPATPGTAVSPAPPSQPTRRTAGAGEKHRAGGAPGEGAAGSQPVAGTPAVSHGQDPSKAREEAAKRKAEREQHHLQAEQQRLAEAQRQHEVSRQLVKTSQQLDHARQQSHEAARRLQVTQHQLQVKAQRQATKAAGGSGEKKAEGGTPAGSSGAGSGSATAASVQPAQSASAIPTAGSAAAVVSAPAPTQPLVVGKSSQPSGKAPRAPARRRSSAARTTPAPAATGGLAPVALTAPASHPAPSLHRVKASKSPSVHQSPIVTTITKIVGVVPSALWALIALLAALALAMAARSRLSALRARRLERQRSDLLEDVGLLQAALLPVAPSRLGPVGTTAAYRPAAGPGAGGDFYDVFALEQGKLAVIVGDVSGHGREALPHTALVRFTLRAYLEAGLSPRVAVQTAGAVLERQLGSSFATVVAATYDPRQRRLVYSCAGHPPPIVLGTEPIVPTTIASAPPVGVGMRTGTRQTVVSIPGAASICFHTDGVTEARVGSRRELYGTDRLTAALAEIGPDASAAALLDRVTELTDSRPDDMAACLLRVEGAPARPAILCEELELDREDVADERTERFLQAVGVDAEDIGSLISEARATAQRSGSVVLEIKTGEGSPKVRLQRDNVAYIQPRLAARMADLKVSL